MRKLFIIMLTLTMAIGFNAMSVSAEVIYGNVEAMDILDGKITFDDGSYLITETLDDQTMSVQAVSTKTYSRIMTYYNSSDVAQCALKVTGTFEINYGISVKCTNVTATDYVYDSSWKVEDITTSRTTTAGATASATANGRFVKRLLFIVTNNIPVTITVSCDKNGNY